MNTCGDNGGTKADGTPCARVVAGDELCYQHDGSGRNGGRPEYQPDELDRRLVVSCVLAGIPQDQICDAIGISKKTLVKHFRDDLDHAYMKAKAKVTQTAFSMAVSGKNPSMTMFWLKTQAGWSTKQEIDVTSDGESVGGAVLILPDNGRGLDDDE